MANKNKQFILRKYGAKESAPILEETIFKTFEEAYKVMEKEFKSYVEDERYSLVDGEYESEDGDSGSIDENSARIRDWTEGSTIMDWEIFEKRV